MSSEEKRALVQSKLPPYWKPPWQKEGDVTLAHRCPSAPRPGSVNVSAGEDGWDRRYKFVGRGCCGPHASQVSASVSLNVCMDACDSDPSCAAIETTATGQAEGVCATVPKGEPLRASACGGKLCFRRPELISKPAFTKLGRTDADELASSPLNFQAGFALGSLNAVVELTGAQRLRGDQAHVYGPYSDLSNFLRSGFFCDSGCQMTMTLSGLQPEPQYLITTYHHSTNAGGGRTANGKLRLEYANGPTLDGALESDQGIAPDPPLSYTALVAPDADGKVVLTITSLGVGLAGDRYGFVDLNGFEITMLNSTCQSVRSCEQQQRRRGPGYAYDWLMGSCEEPRQQIAGNFGDWVICPN
jgi:hypothetical protein